MRALNTREWRDALNQFDMKKKTDKKMSFVIYCRENIRSGLHICHL